MDASALLESVRIALGGAVCGIGLVFLLGGAIGMLRFPDFYTRLHGANVADATGAAVFALGLALMAPDIEIAVRLVLLAALIVALGPVFTHLLASSAHAGGLAPIAGQHLGRAP